MVMTCGVLALQGDWQAHGNLLRRLGVEVRMVRTAAELAEVDALAIPGGESTAMLRLMEREQLAAKIELRISDGMPVLATCAGVILLAREVEPRQQTLSALDISVLRNAYGRQLASDLVPVELAPELGEPPQVEGVFIRAPRITRTGDPVTVLGRRDNDPVLVRQGRIIAATYHPELTDDLRVHQLFLEAASGA
jgi:5'-phosphate synthase pdxT subunit